MGQKEKFRVGRAETLCDKKRCLELGGQRHCGTNGDVQSCESGETVGQKEMFIVGRAEKLWDKRRCLELGERRHCGTKGEV